MFNDFPEISLFTKSKSVYNPGLLRLYIIGQNLLAGKKINLADFLK
jgi:hypothetical protein